MKIVGIVAEYNPLHNGHKYLIDYARNTLNADYIVIALSGDYVQRGEPAVFDKFVRTKTALIAGCDAVFMLPVAISTASAQYYARGAVALLDKLGCNTILFGSENGDINSLKTSEYKNGYIDSPNNILGREYISAIEYLKASIEPVTIKRLGTDYNDSTNIKDNFCSASYIRNNFNKIFMDKSNDNVMSDSVLNEYCLYLKAQKPLSPDSLSDILFAKLIEHNQDGFSSYFDVFDDLSEKIQKNINLYTSYSEFTDLLKSKDITRSHLSRALLHICLDITKKDMDIIASFNYVPYARLLGFKKESDVLSVLSKLSSTCIISKLADFYNTCDTSQKNILVKDIQSAHIYSYLCRNSVINELTQKIVII